MSYSFDKAYLEHFKCNVDNKYESGFMMNRLKVTGMTVGTSVASALRTVGRVANLVIEVSKIAFYELASLFTLGKFGNLDRLRDHCKLLALNNAALLAQPIQLLVHSLAIAIGLVSPKAAYQMMQAGTKPIAWVTAQEQKVWQQYKTPEIYSKLINKNILNEVPYFLKTAPLIPLGCANRFHLFNANPVTLTDEQKKMTPIILLHGNGAFTNQSTWIPLLHSLAESGNERPVYTINLPSMPVREPDREKFNERMTKLESLTLSKVNEIKEDYGLRKTDHIKVDIVGHSMGSLSLQYTSIFNLSNNYSIGKGITVGTPSGFYTISFIENKFDITGKFDTLYTDKSELADENKREIETGHVGLIFHPESLQAMQDFLQIKATEQSE